MSKLSIVARLQLAIDEGAGELAAECRDTIEKLAEALREISLGLGEFNRDPLIHAENTIESMKAIASDALAKIGDAPVTCRTHTKDDDNGRSDGRFRAFSCEQM